MSALFRMPIVEFAQKAVGVGDFAESRGLYVGLVVDIRPVEDEAVIAACSTAPEMVWRWSDLERSSLPRGRSC